LIFSYHLSSHRLHRTSFAWNVCPQWEEKSVPFASEFSACLLFSCDAVNLFLFFLKSFPLRFRFLIREVLHGNLCPPLQERGGFFVLGVPRCILLSLSSFSQTFGLTPIAPPFERKEFFFFPLSFVLGSSARTFLSSPRNPFIFTNASASLGSLCR